jgi:hypothetical protein
MASAADDVTGMMAVKAVEEIYSKEYDKFLRSFSLSSYATEIAAVLDAEVDVAR